MSPEVPNAVATPMQKPSTHVVQNGSTTAVLGPFWLTLQGDLKLMARLLKAGADVNAGDYDKRTPLHIAAAEVNLTAVGSKALSRSCGKGLMWSLCGAPLGEWTFLLIAAAEAHHWLLGLRGNRIIWFGADSNSCSEASLLLYDAAAVVNLTLLHAEVPVIEVLAPTLVKMSSCYLFQRPVLP